MKIGEARRNIVWTMLWTLTCTIGFILLLGVLLVLTGMVRPEALGISDYLQVVIGFASVVFAVITIKRELVVTQKLQEAEFIVSLNDKFNDNDSCKAVFAYGIWEAHKKMLDCHKKGEQILDDTELERVQRIVEEGHPKLMQVDISSYLTYFESIFLLLANGVVRWEAVNDLLKYRFFAVIHSDFIQSERLVRLPDNFKNIYCLEKLWMEYNRNDSKLIARFDNRLEVACERAGKSDEYRRIMREMDSKYKL